MTEEVSATGAAQGSPQAPGTPDPVGHRVPAVPHAGGFRGPVPAPPKDARPAPGRVTSVEGTPFGLVHLEVAPVTSGLAIGALVAGIVSILVAALVGCFGLLGAQGGWGAWAGGAFALLGMLTGLAGMVSGLLGRRQIRRSAAPSAVRFTGRGLAVAGVVCGAVGLVLTMLSLGVALLLQIG